MHFDVIVIGAGAAGMMAAARAGQRGRRVLLIDHASKLAEKIRISGGGRCNFTNLDVRPECFLSRNPHFCRAALATFGARDFIALVRRHGIPYHEKTLGQLFCNDSAKDIIDLLVRECEQGGVHWARPEAVHEVSHHGVAHHDGGAARFTVATGKGRLSCRSLIVATGGLTVPAIGATDFGYRLARQFGLKVVEPRPALVPLTMPADWLAQFGGLAGASFDCEARCDRPAFRESALITHRGLSGPAILQVSSYWQEAGRDTPVTLDLFPDDDPAALLAAHRRSHASLATLLSEHLPRRFASAWAESQGWTLPLAELSNRAIDAAAQALRRWTIEPAGTLGFDKAEVTLGGIDTDELDQRSLEAKRVPGLYFVGEVVDVTGWLGGYNFQWAWSSGHCAGMAA